MKNTTLTQLTFTACPCDASPVAAGGLLWALCWELHIGAEIHVTIDLCPWIAFWTAALLVKRQRLLSLFSF